MATDGGFRSGSVGPSSSDAGRVDATARFGRTPDLPSLFDPSAYAAGTPFAFGAVASSEKNGGDAVLDVSLALSGTIAVTYDYDAGPAVVPLPAGLPPLLGGLAALAGMARPPTGLIDGAHVGLARARGPGQTGTARQEPRRCPSPPIRFPRSSRASMPGSNNRSSG